MYYQWKDARFQYTDAKNLVGTLLLLQVVENNLGGFSFQAPVLDNDTGAANNFSGLSFFVDLAESSPLSEFLVVINFHQGNVVLLAEGRNQLQAFSAIMPGPDLVVTEAEL